MFEAGNFTVNGSANAALPDSPGLFDISTTLAGGREARFTLSLPAATGSETAPPLFIILHYGGTPTPYYGRPLIEMLFGPAWAQLGGIFIAPESIDGQWHTEANEAFVINLMDAVSSHYRTDTQRTVVAGYSMGAIGSWHFITHYPERFSAAIPVAGFPHGAVNCLIPVFTFATESDEIFDFDTFSARVDELQQNGCDVTLQTVAARGHYDVAGFSAAVGETRSWLESIWAQ